MEQQAPSINLLDVLRGIGRHKLLILSFTVLGFAASYGYVSTLKPLYSTEAQVLIENLSSPYDKVQSTEDQRPDAVDDRTIQSQISVLRSRDLAARVVSALNLQKRDEFDSLKSKGIGRLKQILLDFGFGEDPRLMTPEERALKRYSAELNVYQIPASNVVAVKYSANDAATAAEVANALVNTYVTSTAEAKFQPTVRAREWLGLQITDLRKKLAGSEAAIESFRTEAGLLKGQTSTLGSQELSELNTQITLAEAARTEAYERAKAIKQILASKGTVDASTDVVNSPNVQRLRDQQASSARRVAELSAIYLPNHPKMIAAQNDLTNINRQIRAEALKVVEGLDQQAKIAQARESSLRARLEQMKGSTSTANLDDVKLQAMERDAAADKALLESLLLRYADASARQDLATQPGFARVIQSAAKPTSPSFPKTGPMVLLMTLAGFALSLGLSFLLEIMSAANRLGQQAPAVPVAAAKREAPPTQEQMAAVPVAETVLTPVFAGFPSGSSLQANQELLKKSIQHDSFGLLTAAGQVADWALNRHRTSAMRQLAVLSLGGGVADSSLSAVVVARAIALKNARVIVVDLASSGSSVDMLFGLPMGPGFVDLLAGTVDFTKVIARDPLSTTHLLRFGMEKNDVSISLLSQRADAVLNALGSIYDIVIVHVGEASASTPTLVAKCQAALLVAPALRQKEVAKATAVLSMNGQVEIKFVKLEPWKAGGMRLAATA
jgi:polysaccharide biosynthesis transport protein